MRIMRGTSAAILTLVIFLTGCGGKPPRGHYEKAGGFSYDPPKGWQIIQLPGLKYRIAHGPTENEFAPNINVVDEAFMGTLAEYVDLNLENMKKMFRRSYGSQTGRFSDRRRSACDATGYPGQAAGPSAPSDFLFLQQLNPQVCRHLHGACRAR